jgi:uncharacterized protein YndB with AHSA1/START domain
MTMTDTQEAPGEVTVAGDNLQVVFHRHYAKPIEKVWAAITTPERLADWLADAEIEMRTGGTIRFHWTGPDHRMEGRVVACEPPHTFAWTWPLGGRETVVRFDLASDGDGCRLTLTHSGLSPRAGPGAGVRSGWHSHLAGLADAIEGRRTAWETISARLKAVADLYPALPA